MSAHRLPFLFAKRPSQVFRQVAVSCTFRMTTLASSIASPPINREMKVLDRGFFKTKVNTSAVTILDPKEIQRARKILTASNNLLQIGAIKPIRDDDTLPGAKCLLLEPKVKTDDPATWGESLTALLQENTAKLRPFELTVSYDNWTMTEILDAVLPEYSGEDEHNPSGFAQVGHIAHMNLRESFLPYKHLIGQVLVDKNPSIRTVINKLQNVGSDSVFRTFPYEVLVGHPDLDVTIKHADCVFKFNFAEVYWNTRNETEHKRLLSLFQPGEAVCDVTAGVGPFSIPAGKKNVWVRANDLNPACYKGLEEAAQANKVQNLVKAYNMDGSEFIHRASQDLLDRPRSFTIKPSIKLSRNATAAEKSAAEAKVKKESKLILEPPTFDHFVSNLPATGLDFLAAFKGIYDDCEHLFEHKGGPRRLPMIHTYTFQARRETEAEEEAELQQRVSEKVGHQLGPEHELSFRQARLVAPNKWYYCASFRLPAEVAFAVPETQGLGYVHRAELRKQKSKSANS